MKCQKAREFFDDYMNGVLEEPAASDMKVHLESCRDCGDELRFLEMVHQKTTGLSEEKAPTDLLAKIHARIDAPEKQSFFRKIILPVPQFAGVAVALVLAIILFKLNSQPILKEPAPNLLTESNEARTFENATPPDAVKPAAPAIGAGQKRMSANNDKPSGGVTDSTALQAPVEAKAVAVKTLLVKVIPVTDNKSALTDQAKEETASNAPLSFSKGTRADLKKEKTDTVTRENAAPDPVEAILEKYQGRVIKTENPTRSEEWAFDIPSAVYSDFLADLAKIGQVTDQSGPGTDRKTTGEVELFLKVKE